jgi:hypothetical protein
MGCASTQDRLVRHLGFGAELEQKGRLGCFRAFLKSLLRRSIFRLFATKSSRSSDFKNEISRTDPAAWLFSWHLDVGFVQRFEPINNQVSIRSLQVVLRLAA